MNFHLDICTYSMETSRYSKNFEQVLSPPNILLLVPYYVKILPWYDPTSSIFLTLETSDETIFELSGNLISDGLSLFHYRNGIGMKMIELNAKDENDIISLLSEIIIYSSANDQTHDTKQIETNK